MRSSHVVLDQVDIAFGQLRWLHRLPPVASRHATASTDPRFHEDGQTARPGNRRQHKRAGRPSRRLPDGEP